MEKDEIYEALNIFRKYVITQSRRGLTMKKKNASKALWKSLKSDLKEKRGIYTVVFEMNEYGMYIDKGVSGIKTKYNTPFKYTKKMPPANKLDKWIVKRGIAPRDKNGKFIPRKSVQFAIARGIFYHGIKPSLFFTKPFTKAFDKLPEEVIEAMSRSIGERIDLEFKALRK